MRIKRCRAFFIDFLILLIVFNIINFVVPKSDKLKDLDIKQNIIIENFTTKNISFAKYMKDYSIVYYDLCKEKLVSNLIYLVFVIIYFILIPFIWKGRTIGCFINGIQIERFDKGKLHLYQLFIRSLIVIGLGYIILSNILLFIIPSKFYFICVSSIGMIQISIALFSANMILFSKEKRGIQDIISNTEITKIMK